MIMIRAAMHCTIATIFCSRRVTPTGHCDGSLGRVTQSSHESKKFIPAADKRMKKVNIFTAPAPLFSPNILLFSEINTRREQIMVIIIVMTTQTDHLCIIFPRSKHLQPLVLLDSMQISLIFDYTRRSV